MKRTVTLEPACCSKLLSLFAPWRHVGVTEFEAQNPSSCRTVSVGKITLNLYEGSHSPHNGKRGIEGCTNGRGVGCAQQFAGGYGLWSNFSRAVVCSSIFAFLSVGVETPNSGRSIAFRLAFGTGVSNCA